MTKRLLVSIVCFWVAMCATPLVLSAAQTTRTLQPGYTYEFVGLDPRVISHVNIVGTGRYQFAETNAAGELLRFGTSNWRIAISGTGYTAITPLAPMRVSFDTRRVRLQVSPGSVLTELTLDPGSSIALENTTEDTKPLRFRIGVGYTYDFALTNHLGEVYNTGAALRLPQLNIIPGGTKTVTAQEGPLTLYFPSTWYGAQLVVTRPQYQALITHTLAAGQTVTIANTTRENITVNISATHDHVAFRYDFILRGRDGHVTNYGTTVSSHITIPRESAFTFTPLVDGEMVIPHTLLGQITLAPGDSAPMYTPLLEGESITITNNDPTRAHTVFLRCGTDSGSFSFYYVLEDDEDISFRILEDITAPRHSFSIPPGATATLTIADALSYVAVLAPDIEAITTAQGYSTLVRHVVPPNSSIYITNNTDETIDMLAIPQGDPQGFDLVRYHLATGEVETFGRTPINGQFTIDFGQSVLLTTQDEALTFVIPQALLDQGITFEETTRIALFRQSLTYGDILQIDNSDRLYDHFFLIEDDARRPVRQPAFAYEYLLTSIRARDAVMVYGLSHFGYHTVPTGHRITIMPRPGMEISVVFPAEWHGRPLQTRPAREVPLRHIRLAPGERITFHNSTNAPITISNNSATTAAGFHPLRDGQTLDIRTATPQSGDIIVMPGQRLTIVAALGADLEIWMPQARARQLRVG